MTEAVLTNLIFMAFEIFILLQLMKRRETHKENILWTPFRILLLDSIVSSHDELLQSTDTSLATISSRLKNIQNQKQLTADNLVLLRRDIDTAITQIESFRRKFFDALQTSGPSMRPHAAGYCTELLFFFKSTSVFFERMEVACQRDFDHSDNEESSRALNDVRSASMVLNTLIAGRFRPFKERFVRSVWKTELLHYYEPDDGFLTPEDYQRSIALDELKTKNRHGDTRDPRVNFFDRTPSN